MNKCSCFCGCIFKVGPANFNLDDSAEQLDAIGDDIQDLIESGNTDSASSLIIAVADYLNLESSNEGNYSQLQVLTP